MIASNTRECFRMCVGKRIRGVVFDARSPGTKTLILDDWTGLTMTDNGSFWIDGADVVQRDVRRRLVELEALQRELSEIVVSTGPLEFTLIAEGSAR